MSKYLVTVVRKNSLLTGRNLSRSRSDSTLRFFLWAYERGPHRLRFSWVLESAWVYWHYCLLNIINSLWEMVLTHHLFSLMTSWSISSQHSSWLHSVQNRRPKTRGRPTQSPYSLHHAVPLETSVATSTCLQRDQAPGLQRLHHIRPPVWLWNLATEQHLGTQARQLWHQSPQEDRRVEWFQHVTNTAIREQTQQPRISQKCRECDGMATSSACPQNILHVPFWTLPPSKPSGDDPEVPVAPLAWHDSPGPQSLKRDSGTSQQLADRPRWRSLVTMVGSTCPKVQEV